jgi:hypothetical protein
MNKVEALKKAIERKKEDNAKNFERKVEALVWTIEKKSQELRDLKKELTELTFEEIDIPDVSDCLEPEGN